MAEGLIDLDTDTFVAANPFCGLAFIGEQWCRSSCIHACTGGGYGRGSGSNSIISGLSSSI